MPTRRAKLDEATGYHLVVPQRRTLLTVFGHPDDVTVGAGGVLAWSAAAGVRVVIFEEVFGRHRIDGVVRFAACKSVELCESTDDVAWELTPDGSTGTPCCPAVEGSRRSAGSC